MTATLKHYLERFFAASGQQRVEMFGQVPNDKTIALGLDLIFEEFSELCEATVDAQQPCNKFEDGSTNIARLAPVADALADLLYVVMWNAVAWRIPIVEVMEEVQRTNMAKFPPGEPPRVDPISGKILKPVGWTQPDLLKVLTDAYLRTKTTQE